MNKAAIFFVSGYEEIEALAVVDLLRRAQVEVLMVSVNDEAYATSARCDIVVKMDVGISAVDFDSLDMIILPGGPGTPGFEESPLLMEQILRFHEQEKPIAAICAAPGVLGRMGILAGRRACSYPTVEGDLRGATVVKDKVVRDGHIFTARGMGCSIDFGLALVAYFKGDQAARELAERIVYYTERQPT